MVNDDFVYKRRVLQLIPAEWQAWNRYTVIRTTAPKHLVRVVIGHPNLLGCVLQIFLNAGCKLVP